MVEVSRRRFLAGSSALGLLAVIPSGRLAAMTRPGPGRPGLFLNAHQLDTLRALTGRLLPGPPDDPDPGAVEAGAAEAIDLLLGAFKVDPPLIHAGGPFSDRAGAHHDDMADFVALDALAERGWRIRIEGSLGRPDREFGGPVRGLQQIYTDGLASLDAQARARLAMDFVALPAPAQDLLLRDSSDAATTALLDVALPDTLAAVYGPPEYGGNRALAGWKPIGWPGDAQPRGYTDAEVSQADPPRAGAPLLTQSEARAALARLMPALAGRPQTTATWWRGRRPYGRG